MTIELPSAASVVPPRARPKVFDRLPIWAWLVGVLVLVTGTTVVVNFALHQRTLHTVLDDELSEQAHLTGLAVQADIDAQVAQLQRQVLAADPTARASAATARATPAPVTTVRCWRRARWQSMSSSACCSRSAKRRGRSSGPTRTACVSPSPDDCRAQASAVW